jgi:transketolase C-terminal domain/subunit
LLGRITILGTSDAVQKQRSLMAAISKQRSPLLRLGVQDSFSQPGDYEYLLKQNRLQPEEVAYDISKKLLEH